MTLTGTADIAKTFVQRLGAYVSPTGATLANALNQGTTPPVFIGQAPDGQTSPYLLLRLLNQRADGNYRNGRLTFDVEVIVFVRPRSKQQDAEKAADVVLQSMSNWLAAPNTAGTPGLIFGQHFQRDTLPTATEPADRDVVMIRILASCVAWPTYLTAV